MIRRLRLNRATGKGYNIRAETETKTERKVYIEHKNILTFSLKCQRGRLASSIMIPQQVDLSPFINEVFADSRYCCSGVLHVLPAARYSVYSALLCSGKRNEIPKELVDLAIEIIPDKIELITTL